MTYLLTQIVIALLAAAALGFFLGWWFGQRAVDGAAQTDSEAGRAEPAGESVQESPGPG